jgi:hypothetical protein
VAKPTTTMRGGAQAAVDELSEVVVTAKRLGNNPDPIPSVSAAFDSRTEGTNSQRAPYQTVNLTGELSSVTPEAATVF